MAEKKKKPRRYTLTQAYFRTVLANEKRIQYLEDEIVKQQSRLALNGVGEGLSVSRTLEGDSFEKGFIKLYDTIEAMDTELIGYVEERQTARQVLGNIADTLGYDVLFLRYLEGYRLNDIAKELFLSRQHVYRLHEESLMKLYPFIPVEFKQRQRSGDTM